MSANLGGAGRLEWLLNGLMNGFTPEEEKRLKEELETPQPRPFGFLFEQDSPLHSTWFHDWQKNHSPKKWLIESFFLTSPKHFEVPSHLTPQSNEPHRRVAHRKHHRRAPGTFLVHRDDFGLWILEERFPVAQDTEAVWKHLPPYYNQYRAELSARFQHYVAYSRFALNDSDPVETASRVLLTHIILKLPAKNNYLLHLRDQRHSAKLQSVDYANAHWRAGLHRRFEQCAKREQLRAHIAENRKRKGQLYYTVGDLIRGIRSDFKAEPKHTSPVPPRLFEPIMSDSEDMDLFGDVEEEVPQSPRREDSDREDLDSGDDEGRDRSQRTQDREVAEEDYRFEETGLVPHQVPAPSDGELNTLRMPGFVKIDPLPFDQSTFTPPTVGENESAFDKAASTIRYRKNDKGELESNALFNRWSDGSVTISIGETVYELMAKPLAPKVFKDYQDVLDSHTYLASPHVDSQLMQIVGHVNNSFTIVPNADLQAKAVAKLKENMAKSGRHNDHKDVANQIVRTEDPETQKRKAEQLERERNKLAKRREQAAQRTEQRISGRPSAGTGLGMGGIGRAKKPAGVKKSRARRDEYDSEEEMDRGRGRREDEYDMDDGFMAASDSEEEEERGHDEESEEEYERNSPPRTKKQKRAKGSDDDASGESDTGARAPSGSQADAGGRRKRQVIEDDEDDE